MELVRDRVQLKTMVLAVADLWVLQLELVPSIG